MSNDLSLGFEKGAVAGNAFVSGYSAGDPNGLPKPTGPSYNSIGGNLGLQGPSGGGRVQAEHIPNFGNKVSASVNANLVNRNDHKVDVHAFAAKNFREGPIPNYTQHGGGVNYEFKEKFNAGASVTHTPIAGMTQHNLTAGMNLHKTPSSSLDFNVESSRTTTPFGRSPWQSGGAFVYKKQF